MHQPINRMDTEVANWCVLCTRPRASQCVPHFVRPSAVSQSDPPVRHVTPLNQFVGIRQSASHGHSVRHFALIYSPTPSFFSLL